MIEHWEKIIENEIEFYKNFQDYKQDLLDYIAEHAFIDLPTTIFDDELGQVYLSCPGTEVQAIRRIEIKERIEASLKRAAKRINRLLNSIRQLEKHEQRTAQILLKKDLFIGDMAKELELSIEEFWKARETVLKKIYVIYEKERGQSIRERENAEKEMVLKKAGFLKKALLKGGSDMESIEDPRKRIWDEIEHLEMQSKIIQRNASAFYHWNDNSVYRHQTRVQPADMSGRINQINDKIRNLRAELAEMEANK